MPINKRILLALLALTAIPLTGTVSAHTLKVVEDSYVEFGSLVKELKEVDIVFIGDVAIALEMIRKDYQPVLDRWVAGDLAIAEMYGEYKKNWGMWPRYRPIFEYARDEKIPMVGLNLPREITGQVAKGGFRSLTEDHLRLFGSSGSGGRPRCAESASLRADTTVRMRCPTRGRPTCPSDRIAG